MNKYQQALVLFREGKTYIEISASIDTQVETIRAYVSRARLRGDLPPGVTPTQKTPRLAINQSLIASFRPEAKRRGLTETQLARRILERVCEDGLIGAVLDDGASEHA
ncbi:hypothetical protein [Aliiroseovarius lamellibrachiae]|uniref:hypothetical protein n=1 Tax=Aliiroseovarius lamellibrachiae TaxID=1924933 RepID=UPI001BE0FA99|nr:hypothetical protein [Aliiroseovarius lamellibrachiae]MBT2131202.1 hypothetical protein [Aliiroseovarius lamellibrachiae]